MRLIDIINAPWAVTPDMLDEVHAIYGRHLRGDKIDLAQLSAATGLSFDNQAKGYVIDDGVAVLPIDGVIAKRMNLFSKISGGTSSQLIGAEIGRAMADREVQALVLAIDSPGGTVDGTPELADIVLGCRGVKPVLACTDGMMCSAAYWIGSAADQVLISSEVAVVGSIGVVTKHIDASAAEAKAGIRTTEIFAGRYKRIDSQYAPLTDEGRAYLQAAVDHAYSVFVDAVGRHRGAGSDEVLSRMADGRTFHGSQAITAGLVDGVATLAEVIVQARGLARRPTKQWAGVARTASKESTMDLQTMKETHPDLVEAIAAEATAGIGEQIAQATAAGAQAERDRVAAVRAQLLPGHEALIERLAADGQTTGEEAAKAVLAAERDLRTAAAQALDSQANPPVASVPAEEAIATMSRADFDAADQHTRRAFLAAGGRIN
jgi:capsid assembly protease